MVNNPLKIVFICSEAVPFAKTGGMADVVGSLPATLGKLGHSVSLIMPRYRSIDHERFGLERVPVELDKAMIPASEGHETKLYRSGAIDGVTTYLIDAPQYFEREHLYGTPDGDYSDNDERFAFFSRGAIEVMRRLELAPDVIHCHDWQTGLVPVYLRTPEFDEDPLRGSRVFFTVHNLAYQGNFPFEALTKIGLPPILFRTEGGLEFYGNISYLKAGIVFSDVITTVSPTYSREIQKDGLGLGFEGILRARSGSLHGIVNGIDYSEWNPGTDRYLAGAYSRDDLAGKAVNKRKLLEKCGIEYRDSRMIFGMISRLAEQKGLDILSDAIPSMLDEDVCFVILGFGDKHYHDLLGALSKEHPDKLSVTFAFDNEFAHLIYAGSDAFLMPSWYEPCGLGQLIAMKYGTPPIVRSTGGLKDTVTAFDPETGFGTGFVFEEYTTEALQGEMKKAVDLHRNTPAWHRLVTNCMGQDYSWDSSALQYIDLYRNAPKEASHSTTPEMVG